MSYKDVMMIESVDGYEADDELEYYSAIQNQINEGCWSLQGSHGRAMMAAIESGSCLLGKVAARDYWGNRIPSRTEVEDGTKGSASFVSENRDAEWAAHMEAL